MSSLQKNNFMNGGGEMGKLIRLKDWSKTSLGDPVDWPQSLLTMTSVMLDNPFGMYIAWGSDYIQLYNDGYRPILGTTKHPQALGISTRETFSEIWHIIGAMFDDVMKGKAVGCTDFLLPLSRNGFVEDCYFDFSYSPIKKDDGEVGGVLVTVIETTDKKKAQSELKESKDQLQFAIDASELATWDIDPATNQFTGNNRLKEWHGLQLDETFSMEKGFDRVIEKDRDSLKNAITKALEYSSGGMLDHEYTILNPLTKKERIVRAKGRTSFGANNIAYRLNGILEDVTEQVMAKRKIEESERSLRLMIIQAPVAICVFKGSNHVVEIANDLMLELWGKTSVEVFNKPIFEGLPEAAGQGLEQIVDTVFSTGEKFVANEWPVKLPRKNKVETTYVNLVYEALKNTDGSVSGIMAIATDVTAEVNARKKTVKSDLRFRNTVKQAPIGITILRGADFMVEMANDAYLQVVDRNEAEFVGKPLFDSLPEVKEAVSPLLNDVLNTGIPFHGIEYPVPVKRYGKQEISYFDFLYHPLREEDGKISGIIVTVTDVSASVKAKYTLAESEKQFRNLVMHSPIAMSIFKGEDHIIEMANEVMFEKVWRKKESEVIGKKVLDVFPELKEQKYAELLDAVYHRATVHNEKESLAFVSGDDGLRKLYLDYEYRPLFQTDGTIFGIMITVYDVTEKVEYRKKVEESEERLRMATQMTNLGTWEYNPISGELNWSEECKEIYNLPENEKVDFQLFSKHIHPQDKDFVDKAIRQAIDPSGDGKYDIVYRIVRFKDNSTRWIRAKGKVYFNTVNEAERFIGTVVDITEQKLSQQILEESEQRSRLSIEAAHMGTFDWDLQTNEFISSQRLNDIFGFQYRTNITHKDLIDAFHPEDKAHRNEAVENAALKGALSYEARIVWPDKSIHWIRVYGKIIYNAEQPFKMYGIVVDNTEEQINLRALEESTERLNIAIEAAELGMWELDIKSNKTYYSVRYLEILGYPQGTELTHVEIQNHLYADDLPVREIAFKKAYKTGILQYESRIIWNDKSIHWIEKKGKVFYNENKEPVRLLGTLRDITEEKYYQQELIDRERKFRLLADSMPEFVWTSNINGEFNYFNQSVYNYTGLTPLDIENGGWLNVVHPEEREENKRRWMRAVKNGTDFLFEHRFRKFDGTYRWQLSRAVAQKDANGNIQMWVGTSTDIEEQKVFTNKLELQVKERTAELQKVNEALEKSNIELEQFAYVASHDLQEPLRKIRFFTERLENSMLNAGESANEYYLKIQKASDRMNTLIKDLLDFSRLSKKNELFVKIDLNEVISNVLQDLELLIQQKEAIVEITHLPVIEAIPLQMQQLFYNLLSNALKFSKPNVLPVIKISADVLSQQQKTQHNLNDNSLYYVVKIIDNGIGFDQEYAEQIFVIFQRLNDLYTYGGTGIGLALCRKIALNHHGKIFATGEEGEGAAFYIIIPQEQNKI
jgi:PAS domain S-box-containing protein